MPGCRHEFLAELGHESVFTIDVSSIVFGRGAIAELGEHAAALGMTRVGVFTDPRVAKLPFFESAKKALGGIDHAVFDASHVEPTDESFLEAARFAKDGRFDGYVSIGGGSAIDTCKAASLYARYPDDFLAYVNAPIGAGKPVPGPLPPHVACPTTSGTGA